MHALFGSRFSHAFAIALTVALSASTAAAATSVATEYQRIQAREKAARATAAPVVATLRAVAKSYETFTRAHPVSGYADNALWQAAGLYETVFARTKDRKDADQVTRLLTWLKKEYPTGTLARQADARLKLTAAPAASAAATAAPPAASAPAKAPPPKPADVTGPRESDKGTLSAEIVSVPLPALPGPAAAASVKAPAISILDVTYGSLPKGDRVTIELNAEVTYATSRAENPDRVFVELLNAGATAPIVDRASKISGPLVKSLTVARGANGAARLVLQLAGKPRFSTFPLYDPFRLVIDVESDALPPATGAPATQGIVAKSVARTSFAAGAAPAPVSADPPAAPASAASTSAGDYSLARQLGLSVSRVVIDPGHGGHDPGAQANGVSESALVLDVALRLEALLVRRGVDVVLTRRTDDYVPLEERTALANRAAADMFVSIHANASPQGGARGVETFFLDFATNPHAQAVAARENAASTQAMRVLPELVKTIALTNKLQESQELATMVQASLTRRLQAQNKGVADLGVKRAPFVVLIGAQMPSVLAEVSFVTNRSDASLLKQLTYRDRIAQALADAVVKYQGSLKKGTTVAARNEP